MQESVEGPSSSISKPELSIVPKKAVSDRNPRGKVRERVKRICIVCDNDFPGDPQSMYDTESCKAAAQRDRFNGQEVKPRGPSDFELKQRDIRHSSGLTPDRIVLAREILLEVERQLMNLMQNLEIQEFDQLKTLLARRLQSAEGGYMVVVDPAATLGEVYRAWREKEGLSQRDVVRLSGVKQSFVAQFELNKIKRPKLEKLSALAEAVGITAVDLIARRTPKLIE